MKRTGLTVRRRAVFVGGVSAAFVLGVLVAGGIAQPPVGGKRPAPLPVVDSPLPPVNDRPLELTADEANRVRVYDSAHRSVVNITTRGGGEDGLLLLAPTRQGSGSGCVLTKDGHILTNFHVIEGADEINVTLNGGKSHTAKVIGSDPNNDLAVLQVAAPADTLHPIPWGDSEKLLVGVQVFALGNPFGLERTMTSGMVGSLGRTLRAENGRLIRGVIQTDAAINPGNSGGPLLNRRGELVGITTAIIGRAGQSSGVGLAVPGNTARRVADELIRFGRIVRSDCGIEAAYRTEKGLLIARLTDGGPADKAGLRGPEITQIRRGLGVFQRVDRSKADLVTAVDGKAVRTMDEMLTLVEARKPGDEATFSIVRDGKAMQVTVRLAPSR